MTDLATNNKFARVRGGNLGHQVGSRVWVGGLWQLERRLLSTENGFYNVSRNQVRNILHTPAGSSQVLYRMVSRASFARPEDA